LAVGRLDLHFANGTQRERQGVDHGDPRTRKRDQLRTAWAFRLACREQPITTVQTKDFGGHLQRISVGRDGEQKANIMANVPSPLSDVHGPL
jgi:hypothetical protein